MRSCFRMDRDDPASSVGAKSADAIEGATRTDRLMSELCVGWGEIEDSARQDILG
jgi:hypothetical protein